MDKLKREALARSPGTAALKAVGLLHILGKKIIDLPMRKGSIIFFDFLRFPPLTQTSSL